MFLIAMKAVFKHGTMKLEHLKKAGEQKTSISKESEERRLAIRNITALNANEVLRWIEGEYH